ncbi:aspartate/glutamate racemase family protein [Enterovirga rhinocerotis]|uniref:Asp/Glu/hydantoin racemase n=1 Tax=Enterovirga rhinocerotis TaxID=1339210 RepID=A0A4V3DXQ9_9HYPH|nr:aspartate/glutamate racemase family protein [Enterovirga rhinocerotis]TDR89699.1 Asp/Glu/hydantoin racemase [Enterovirga rhinocerotis]
MRLLLINPNTSPSITELMAARAASLLGPEVALRTATGRFGGRYIASRAASAVAGHAALDAYAEHGEGCDAVLIACFGDPGLLALREMASVPVVGMAEASCHLACLAGRRFSIVTGGERWQVMLEEFVAALGLSARLASIRTVAPTGAEIAADPDRALASLASACRAAAEKDGAEAVILGGAGLAGLAERIAPEVPVPVICSLAAGLEATVAAARRATRKPAMGSFAPTPRVETVGLSTALASRFEG